MNTVATIKELAAKKFGRELDTIDEDTQIAKFGIDSLGFLEFLFDVEDAFSLSIPHDSVSDVHTLRELATVVDRLVAARTAVLG
jgi:acyl carrier protein